MHSHVIEKYKISYCFIAEQYTFMCVCAHTKFSLSIYLLMNT